MRRFVLLTLTLMLGLSGCRRVTTLRLINHSGQDLQISYADGYFKWHGYVILKDTAHEFPVPLRLVIKHSDGAWGYEGRLPVYRHDYRYRKGHLLMQDFQIEPDGAIYLLPPRAQGPITKFPEQEAGFPWRPTL